MVYAHDLGSCAERRGGSSPLLATDMLQEAAFFAYEPEGQAIAAHQLQFHEIRFHTEVYESRSTYNELGLKWHWLRFVPPLDPCSWVKILSIDTDQQLLRKLTRGQIVTVIDGGYSRPDIAFGRNEQIVAALLDSKRRPIYKSPGFDLESYFEQRKLGRQRELERFQAS